METMKIKHRFTLIFRFVALCCIFLSLSCNNQRVRDRFDEAELNRREDHYNLYRRNISGLNRQRIPFDAQKAMQMQKENDAVYYKASFLHGLEPLSYESMDNMENYGVIGICWADNPPVLRFYQRLFSSSAIAVSCPVDQHNSRIIERSKDAERHEVIVSLRQGTILPYFMMDDYEIFKLTLEHDLHSGDWSIKDVVMLTSNREENVQPMFNGSYNIIAYVQINSKGESSLWRMDADGNNKEKISDNASMPYFLPESGRLIFVKQAGRGRDFFVYDCESRDVRGATTEEVNEAFRFIPYARLKENYMRIGNFNRNPLKSGDPELVRKFSFQQAASLGLSASPVILRDYYNYEAAVAESSENFYDIGVDFFGAGYYSLANNLLVREKSEDADIGDHIGKENFLRLVGGLSIPVIPNIPLRQAIGDRDKWQAEAAREILYKTVNEYISELISACFDYAEHKLCIENYKLMLESGRRNLYKLKIQRDAGTSRPEQHLAATEAVLTTEAELHNEVENLIASQLKIATLLGLNLDKGIELELPDMVSLFDYRTELPPLDWFQAQGQINHPDIQRVNAMIMEAAATRDMGPPSTRTTGVSVSLSYGWGFWDWSKALDDFLLLGANYIKPLRLPQLYNLYYDNWASRIESLRQEKYRVQAQIKYDIHEAYKDLIVQQRYLESGRARRDFYQERLRLSKVFEELGKLEFQELQTSFYLRNYDDPTGNALKMYNEKNNLMRMKCEYFRRLAKLYAVSASSFKLLPDMIRQTDPVRFNAREDVRGLYLWISLDVINSREARNSFLELCRKRNINRVYCFISRTRDKEFYLEKYDLEFNYFLDLCQRQGIDVYAMMGNMDWVTPGYRDEINSLIEVLDAFNTRCDLNGSARFAGLHLDVEPHGMPDWIPRRDELCRLYIDMLSSVSEKVGRKNLTVDISYNYNGIEYDDGKDFMVEIARYASGMTIMAYLNRERLITGKVLPILSREDLRHCKFTVALETAPIDEEFISFYGMTYGYLKEVYTACDKLFKAYSNFTGLVFHDYNSFRKMQE